VLHGKGKPFPYNEVAADSPDVADCLWRLLRDVEDAVPYNKMLRFRPKGFM